MFDKEKWQEIFSSLKNNKMRTTLTVFGVFWGIFMLIIMLGFGMGFKSMIQEGFGDFATNSLLIWPQQTTKAYKGFPRNRGYMFTNEDVQIIRERFPEIEFIAPKLRAYGSEGANNATRGSKTGAFSVESRTSRIPWWMLPKQPELPGPPSFRPVEPAYARHIRFSV